MHALFTYCACTIRAFKNIKNGSHNTIHTFKNYFATMFFVFNFQFSISAIINSIQTNPLLNGLIRINLFLFFCAVGDPSPNGVEGHQLQLPPSYREPALSL